MPSITSARLLLLFLCASFAAVPLFPAPAAQAQTFLGYYFPEGVKDPELNAAVDAFNAGRYESVLWVAEPLAEQGNKEAQLLVRLTKGVLVGLRESPPTEEELREQKYEAAEQLFHKEGRYEEAIEALRVMADDGDAEAHYRLHQMFAAFARSRKTGTDPDDPAFELKTINPSGRSFDHLEQAARLGHERAQGELSMYFLKSYIEFGDPVPLDRALAWAFRAIRSGDRTTPPTFIYSAYCYGPAYHRDTQLAATWFMMWFPDQAYARAPDVLDEKWDEVREHWRDSYCDTSVEITKDFVRNAHRRALALSEAYGLEVQCSSYPLCPGIKSFWAPLPR